VKAHGHLPPAEVLSADGKFHGIESPQAHISVGPGASIDVHLRGGALDGRTFSLIPMYRSGTLQWICTKGQVPPQYFGSSCR
jgi:hypothetical protein